MTPLPFYYLPFYFSELKDFCQKPLKKLVPPLDAWWLWRSLNKFYESVLKIFWNEVLNAIKTVNKHAIYVPVIS